MRKFILCLLALLVLVPVLAAHADGVDENVLLSREDAGRLFEDLSRCPLLAASGAGAWEGRLRVRADGSFIGEYHDSDADMIYRVSFSGSFSPNVEAHGNTYWLWVEEMSTQQAPGTRAADEYGDPVTFTDPPFGDREYMVLTMPGTPDSDIPEMVQGEIGGTYDEWEDYSRFITLTRLEDGWGFFADPGDPIDYDPEPAPTATPAAAPRTEPMEGRVLIDDELWTLSLLGKELKYGPGYIIHMRNNSGRDLSVAVNAQVRFHEALSVDFWGRDDLSVYDPVICKIPAGADITRVLVFSMTDLAIRTEDDLRMTDLVFSIWSGNEITRDYENILLDWDPAVTAESLFTPLCPIAPKELSGDPSLISVRALGTYQFITGRAGILCSVTNNSGMLLEVGGYNVARSDDRSGFFFAPEVNGQRCGVLGEMRKGDGALNRGWMKPGESAHMFFSFNINGTEVTSIASASIMLEPLTPTQEKGITKELGRYISDLSFNPVAASTATPAPTDIPKELPKNVIRLPDGDLRYNDGLIAFECPGSIAIRVNKEFTGSDGRFFRSGVSAYVENVAMPIVFSFGVEEVPDGESAEEQAWAKKSRSSRVSESYETVAGHTAKCIRSQSVNGSGQGSAMYYIPLSGNRLLEINVFNQQDEELTAAQRQFLDTLEIRDSLYAEPPAGPVQTEEPAPTDSPNATPAAVSETVPSPGPTDVPAAQDLSAWTGYWKTQDESMAEMIITDNGDGTLHAKAMFLPAADFEVTLTPMADGTMHFEDQYGYLIGNLSRCSDGSLRLAFTGGSTMEDEEATEYQGYYARGFSYYPAAYADMWYQTPEDAAATEEDWLGAWRMEGGMGDSTLFISRENSGLRMDVSFGEYRFSGIAELSGDTGLNLLGDDFSCILRLNRKLKKIAMLEVGSSAEEVYDWTGNPYYGVVVYQREEDQPDDLPDELRQEWESPPTVSVLPVQTDVLPIPGKPGYLQVPVARVDATSYIVGSKDPAAYTPERMTDGDETTDFQFSTRTTKLGQEYLYFEFSSPATLDELWMKNGSWRISDGKDQYTRNSRVKKMRIDVQYVGESGYTPLKTVSLKDDKVRKDWMVIDMLGVENVISVRIRIDSIYKGSKYKTDVCISEIMFVRNE